MSPSPGESPGTTPAPTATPPASREVVLGSIFNDRGGMVERAEVVIDADDPAFDRTIDAAGGAYAMRDVPVGTTLTITASAPGFSSRSRTIKVRKPIPFVDEAPNRVDFGGPDGPGFWYFLTDYPEIFRTEPANLAKDVDVDPFSFTFHFSDAIQDDQQGKFEDLVRVVVPAASDVTATITNRTALGRARLRFTWSDDGKKCEVAFALPLVVRTAGAALSVEFDPTADIEDWPKGVSGKRLGFDVVALTVDGSGSKRTTRVAPFGRLVIDEPVPTTAPSADVLWGTTHMTSVRFEPRRDPQPPRLVKVQPLPGNAGDDDLIVLTFDKPVFGFPEGAISAETVRGSNYHLVYGRVTERTEREDFEEADPAKTGGSASSVEFDENDPFTLILHDSSGSFEDQQRFKLFIDPKVEDIHGIAVGGEGIKFEGEL